MFKSTLINSTLKHFSASICSDTKRQIPLMCANKHSEQQREQKKTNKNNGEIDWRYNKMNALEICSCHPAKLLSPPTDDFCWFVLVFVCGMSLHCNEATVEYFWTSHVRDVKRWFTQCFAFLSTWSVKTNTWGPSVTHTHTHTCFLSSTLPIMSHGHTWSAPYFMLRRCRNLPIPQRLTG